MELINKGMPPSGLAHGDHCNRKFRLLLSKTQGGGIAKT